MLQKKYPSLLSLTDTHTHSPHKYTAELQKSGSVSNSFHENPHMDIPW